MVSFLFGHSRISSVSFLENIEIQIEPSDKFSQLPDKILCYLICMRPCDVPNSGPMRVEAEEHWLCNL